MITGHKGKKQLCIRGPGCCTICSYCDIIFLFHRTTFLVHFCTGSHVFFHDMRLITNSSRDISQCQFSRVHYYSLQDMIMPAQGFIKAKLTLGCMVRELKSVKWTHWKYVHSPSGISWRYSQTWPSSFCMVGSVAGLASPPLLCSQELAAN